MHSWPRCPARPDSDIRPEAILSTSVGSSDTARHRQVTLYKGPESSDLDFWFHSRGNSRELDTNILASWGTDFKTLRDTGLLSN